ncbi:uncharacterized protein METZ01_LOCUS433949 [marine metagenome]|uniref:Uncharacterized protein n=1 Tax=marine metagenome TaxID=408172 RepID=A0A382YE13_9ZZZZ
MVNTEDYCDIYHITDDKSAEQSLSNHSKMQ